MINKKSHKLRVEYDWGWDWLASAWAVWPVWGIDRSVDNTRPKWNSPPQAKEDETWRREILGECKEPLVRQLVEARESDFAADPIYQQTVKGWAKLPPNPPVTLVLGDPGETESFTTFSGIDVSRPPSPHDDLVGSIRKLRDRMLGLDSGERVLVAAWIRDAERILGRYHEPAKPPPIPFELGDQVMLRLSPVEEQRMLTVRLHPTDDCVVVRLVAADGRLGPEVSLPASDIDAGLVRKVDPIEVKESAGPAKLPCEGDWLP